MSLKVNQMQANGRVALLLSWIMVTTVAVRADDGTKILDGDPGISRDKMSREEMGEASQSLRISPELLTVLTNERSKGTNPVHARRLKAVLAFRSSNEGEADSLLKDMVLNGNASAFDYWLLARVLAKRGELKDAAAYCEKSLAADQSFFPAKLTRLALDIDIAGPDVALSGFNSSNEAHGDLCYETYLKGVAHLKAGRLDEADRKFESSLIASSEYFHVATGQILALRAVIAEQRGDMALAEVLANRAIEAGGDVGVTAYLIKWKGSREKNFHYDAHEVAKLGLSEFPGDAKLEIAYFTSLVDLGQIKHALAFAERIEKTGPGNDRLREIVTKMRGIALKKEDKSDAGLRKR
jgi:tetratricopeptide (TPR) repeat protein